MSGDCRHGEPICSIEDALDVGYEPGARNDLFGRDGWQLTGLHQKKCSKASVLLISQRGLRFGRLIGN